MMATPEARKPYLRISNLTKRYGPFTALSDIDLEIMEGEFICFLGPSGCGKTTLLRAIAGLDIQTSGRIEQGGRDISVLPPAERDFGIVFQSYALFPNLTIFANIAYGLENRRRPKAEIAARVMRLLEQVGLADQRDKYPAQLSGGQQQRIALARALATEPGLLLLDEPLSALDAKVRARLRHEIKALQRAVGITTIMVTHDQEEALTMADRIVVMNHGVVEQVGTPQAIYRNPASAFVADFIGAMNFLPAQVAGPETVRYGDTLLRCLPHELAAGAPITLAIRPEDIVVQEGAAAAGGGENLLSVQVGELEFLGPFVRATLEGPTGQLKADFSSNLLRRTRLAPGDRLAVQLLPERLRVYPRASGAMSHG